MKSRTRLPSIATWGLSSPPFVRPVRRFTGGSEEYDGSPDELDHTGKRCEYKTIQRSKIQDPPWVIPLDSPGWRSSTLQPLRPHGQPRSWSEEQGRNISATTENAARFPDTSHTGRRIRQCAGSKQG